MIFSELIIWASGISTLLALGTTIWNLMTSGARSNAKLISAIRKDVSDLGRRVDRLEDQVEDTPTTEQMHQLELTMVRLEGELGKLSESLKPVAAVADRLQELMLQSGSRL